MNDEDLRQFLALAEAATPAPWNAECLDREMDCWWVPEPSVCDGGGDYFNRANATFIVAARNLAPALARELLETRALLKARRAAPDGPGQVLFVSDILIWADVMDFLVSFTQTGPPWQEKSLEPRVVASFAIPADKWKAMIEAAVRNYNEVAVPLDHPPLELDANDLAEAAR